jgi:hypothetical protein
LDAVVQHTGAIAQAIGEGHRALRGDERAEVLGLARTGAGSAIAERHLNLARRHAREARAVVKKQRDGDVWRDLKKQGGAKKKEFEASLDEAREYWIDAIDKSDASPQEAKEYADIWDRVSDAARKKGVDGAFDELDEAFSGVEKALSADQDFGRRAQSPLQWWQWMIIIVIVGVAIATLLACLFWAGCAWIYQIFVATCWGTGAIGGWAGICAGFTF